MKLDVQTHFSQGWNLKFLEKAKALGVEEIRDSQPWSKIETTKGEYVFPSQLVNYMDAAESKGIATLLTFASANTLYDSGLTPYTFSGREAYADHIIAVLKKYSGQVQEIEIWNEFNTGNFKGPAAQDDAFYYTELLKVVYDKVKPLFPEVKILGGSVNVIGTGILEEIFKLGALDHMDGVAVHPYRNVPEHVDDELRHLTDVMAKYGAVKPIYATEFGREFADAAEAPDFMLKMATLMASSSVDESYWYALVDQSHFKNMGLLTTAGEEKPAADTFEFLKKSLLPLGDPVRIDSGDDLTLIYRFGTDTYVMWGTDRKIDFASNGTFWNARGQTIAEPDHLSMAPVVFKGEGFKLSESEVIADSLMQYGEGDWQYFARAANGTLTVLELKDWDWTSYFGSQYTKPLRVNADSIAPAGNGANPVQVVERFISDREQLVSIDGSWRTGEGDGIDLHILVNGREIFSKIFSGIFELDDMRIALKSGDLLDFAVGPNQTVQGDSTARHITLTRLPLVTLVSEVVHELTGVDRSAGIEGGLLAGSLYADKLQGFGGDDRLEGGAGDDVLSGGTGRNVLDGGVGFDTTSYATASAAVDVRLSNGALQSVTDGTQDRLVGIEAVVGSRFADRLSGSERGEAFFGSEGDDTIHASLGRDTIDGGQGTDTLSFRAFQMGVTIDLATPAFQAANADASLSIVSIETLVGSEQADTLKAGNAGATIDGARGDDWISGGTGNDNLNGGAGHNTVFYERATSGVTVDLSITGSQNTVGAGTDTISRFNDLVGSDFSDHLFGDAGDNRLDGGKGDDVLFGAAGADELRGGEGADRFVLALTAYSKPAGMDTILDFSRVEGDRVDLSAIDANARTAANESFTIVDTFQRVAGQLILTTEAGGYLVAGDANGDGRADFGFRVVTLTPLIAADFYL